METSFVRQSLEVSAGEATETLVQNTFAEIGAFGFVRRQWTVARSVTFTWVEHGDVWRIGQVKVQTETLPHKGWRFNFSSQGPTSLQE